MSWQRATTWDALAAGPVVFHQSPLQIVLYRVEEQVFAIDNRCPHEGYPLAEGTLDEQCQLTCNWHNWKFDLVTGEEIQLTFTERDKGSLVFSMDGEQIAFVQSNPNTRWDIMTISLDGGQPKQRTTHGSWELDPVWLDNGQISYTLNPEESRRSIAVGSLEDESSRRIISSKNGSAHLVVPAWSPDQSQLYYQRGWPDGPFTTRHMQSGMVEELIANVWMPLLSRDGRRVAYINPPEPHPQYLWRENVEHIVRPTQLP